jgi:hypothetical protein
MERVSQMAKKGLLNFKVEFQLSEDVLRKNIEQAQQNYLQNNQQTAQNERPLFRPQQTEKLD